MSDGLTWHEGATYKGPVTDYAGRVVKHELRLGRAESLSALEGEYAFFTPAILYLLGIVTDQPLCDLMWEVRQDIPIFFKKFRWPMFRRLVSASGDTDWNHALWAVKKEHWDYFLDFYCSLAIHHVSTKQVNRIAAQELLIVDPLSVDGRGLIQGVAETLKITAFGVNGSKYIAAFECGLDPMLNPPALKFYPPDAKTKVFASAWMRGENPHIAEELYLLEKIKNGQSE